MKGKFPLLYYNYEHITCLWNESQFKADSRFARSQWEMALLCNDISHWLGASLESAQQFLSLIQQTQAISDMIWSVCLLLYMYP